VKLNFLLLIAFCCGIVACKPIVPQEDCHIHNTGKFILASTPTYQIIRTANQQIEIDEVAQDTFKFHLTWKDSCSYILMLESSTSKNVRLKKDDRMLVEITEAKANSYKCNVTHKNELVVMEMKKVGQLD